ncbi:hypothetical protein [Chryseobacterium geocarposphaerae]|nr:hypothetical protein [Chryseobacterium geocarposphaerae]
MTYSVLFLRKQQDQILKSSFLTWDYLQEVLAVQEKNYRKVKLTHR